MSRVIVEVVGVVLLVACFWPIVQEEARGRGVFRWGGEDES